MKLHADAATGWPVGAGLFALFLACLYQLYLIFQPAEFLVSSLYERDDAYYYLVIARNLAEKGMATFDGIHRTNGVQLLWAGLLSALARLIEGPIAFMRAVLLLGLGFSLAAGLLLRHLGRMLVSAAFGDLLALLLAGVLVERWNTLQGMEYPLHLTIIAATLIMALRTLQRPAGGALLLFGLLLTLNFWTRLDSVIFSIGIWAAVLWRITRGTAPRAALGRIALLTLPPALGAIGYVLLSWHWGGTWLPISGAAKAHYASRFFGDTPLAERLTVMIRMWLKINLQAFLALVPENLLDLGIGRVPNPLRRPADALLTAIPILSSALAMLAIEHGERLKARYRPWLGPLIFLLVLCLIHAAVMVVAIKDFSHVTRHYYGWFLVFWLLWGGMMTFALLESLAPKPRRALAALLAGGAFVTYLHAGAAFLVRSGEANSEMLTRYRLIARLNRTLPEGAVVGAWNAGILGYFLKRPVINLDGLVNDAAYLERLRAGAPLLPYLKAEHVSHLVDHNQRDLTLAHGERRDTAREFRNGIRWDDVRILDRLGGIYVLELKPGAGG